MDGTLIEWPLVRQVSVYRDRDRVEILRATDRRDTRVRIPCRDLPHQRVLLTLAKARAQG